MSQAARDIEVVNELGLHARAAAKVVKLASQFQAEVVLEREAQRANAKSIMGVLLLCSPKGTTLRLRATGEDAVEAVEAIAALFAAGFGEAE